MTVIRKYKPFRYLMEVTREAASCLRAESTSERFFLGSKARAYFEAITLKSLE